MSEATAIREEVIRIFVFHAFLDYGSSELFRKYVEVPSKNLDPQSLTWEYGQAGFIGAIDSRSPDIPGPDVVNGNGVLKVRELGLSHFRSKLVRHFDTAYKKCEVTWPSRTGVAETRYLLN